MRLVQIHIVMQAKFSFSDSECYVVFKLFSLRPRSTYNSKMQKNKLNFCLKKALPYIFQKSKRLQHLICLLTSSHRLEHFSVICKARNVLEQKCRKVTESEPLLCNNHSKAEKTDDETNKLQCLCADSCCELTAGGSSQGSS